MAKKKGGGGDAPSKKNVQKKKAQAIEDKTFGLKNKNKSKKVSASSTVIVLTKSHENVAATIFAHSYKII